MEEKPDLLTFFRPDKMENFVASDELALNLNRILENPTDFRVYLLHGPSGLGKTSFARLFAGQLGILDTSDYVEINCANNRGIDDASEILAILQSSPMLKYKVIVLDEAHQLTQPAQNKLLKGLEDVRKSNFVFICSTNPEGLIDTIKTRCFGVGFKPDNFPVEIKDLDKGLRSGLTSLAKRMIEVYFPTKKDFLLLVDLQDIIIKYLTYNTNESFSVRQYITFWYSFLVNLKKDAKISDKEINKVILTSMSRYNPILLARFLMNWEKHSFSEKSWPSLAKKIINLETTVESARILILNYTIKCMVDERIDLEYSTFILKSFSRQMTGSDAKALMILAFRKIYDQYGVS